MSDPGLTTATTGGSKSNAQLIYILYLVGLIVPFVNVIGLVMAYVGKGEAAEWLKSHYDFLIRTFWITLLYALAGLILSIVLIGFLIMLFAVIFYIVRCVQGLDRLGKDQPIVNGQTWLFLS